MSSWVEVCLEDDIECEDVIRFDHDDQTYAVYRSPEGEVFATDGRCTHGQVYLDGGLVMDDIIECPKHNGRFNYKTGAPLRTPACIALATYPARLRDGRIEIEIGKGST